MDARIPLAALLLLAACSNALGGIERLAVDGGEGAFAGPGESEGDPGVAPGLVAAARGDVDGVRAAPGAVLPFGQVATACGVSGQALGTPIAAEAGYTLYDTAPGTLAPRTHFVTGFEDGCPRQVTAALALFGGLATHETTRYAADDRPYSATDTAYEEIKGRECGVAAGQPCGAAFDRLAERTIFLSLYPVFGEDTVGEVLLHDGEVAAAAF